MSCFCITSVTRWLCCNAGMSKWLNTGAAARRKHIGKIDKMPEIVNAATGNNIVAFGKMQPLYQVFQQAAVHFLIVHKACRLSFTPVFYAFFYFLNQVGREVIVNINFRILGNLEQVRIVAFVVKIGENKRQVEADHVFQQNDVFFTGFCGQQHKATQAHAKEFLSARISACRQKKHCSSPRRDRCFFRAGKAVAARFLS